MFKDIPHFRGYTISKDGIVLSYHPKNGRGKLKDFPHRLNPHKDRDGYFCVMLRKEGKGYRGRIHRLLLETFVGPCPEGMVCRHLNDNKHDNRLENLCWGTPEDNSKDKTLNDKNAKGEGHGRAKLTDEQVLEIHHRTNSGEWQEVVAVEFGISKSLAGMIKRQEIWKHLWM